MSYLARIDKAAIHKESQMAQLLLASPHQGDLETLAASVMSVIGETSETLKTARESGNRTRLVLRSDTATIMLAKSCTPLGAEHFSRALDPFSTAAERAALVAIIGHHEAFVTLKLRPDAHHKITAPELLYLGVSEINRLVKPLGVLWGPNRRLHHGAGLPIIPKGQAPMQLLLAPCIRNVGPRRHAVLHFSGAHSALGFGLELQLASLDQDTAITAGLAFASACRTEKTTLVGRSFCHDGLTFRIAHASDGARVTLIPLNPAMSGTIAITPDVNEAKTAA